MYFVKELLKRYSLKPIKKWGQHFLVNKEILKKIIKTANLKKGDVILEIGSGTGILTFELAKKVKKVIAIEKDKNLAKILNDELKKRELKNVEIICGDVLKINFDFILVTAYKYKIVANLPFYITSPVIRRFLEIKNKPKLMILLVQKEVAQRICAEPPRMNLLAVSVQFYSKPEIISYVSKKSFWPQPEVNSAILKISKICKKIPSVNTDLFFKIVKIGFSHPRKKILNNFVKGLKLNKEQVETWLKKNKIAPNQRVENIPLKSWIKLTKSFRNYFFVL